ncbi:ABC transporter permease [Limnohabitans radicicola]|uniref:Oligopeptide transport system permease protein OppC n=1 Tax=Limnohabitans radicicola TaxID=2771427 RepID=A0A927FIJ9_9BURK|nr:ABC transporter permease subunit [Limnohabitans radicicola]MBD8051167.1 ABC transporter permease subunit [Limnohabitans radicicola]
MHSSIPAAEPERSPWRDAMQRFRRNKAAVTSLAFLILVTLTCVIGPWLLTHAYDSTDWDALKLPPSLSNSHWWGTDESGRDLLVRCLMGGRISLMVGILTTMTSIALGVVWGATAGYLGGAVDQVMMRIVDIMYAVPYLLIAILLVTVLGRDFYLVVLAITAFSWMDTARLVRGQTLSLRKMEFVEAARAMGVSTPRIVIEHIVPNLLGLVLVYATVTVPSVILTESVLSFLGLGIQEPMTSWGVLIHDGAQMLDSAPWLLIFPALMLSLTLYSFNYLGDGLRDALDPKDR